MDPAVPRIFYLFWFNKKEDEENKAERIKLHGEWRKSSAPALFDSLPHTHTHVYSLHRGSLRNGVRVRCPTLPLILVSFLSFPFSLSISVFFFIFIVFMYESHYRPPQLVFFIFLFSAFCANWIYDIFAFIAFARSKSYFVRFAPIVPRLKDGAMLDSSSLLFFLIIWEFRFPSLIELWTYIIMGLLFSLQCERDLICKLTFWSLSCCCFLIVSFVFAPKITEHFDGRKRAPIDHVNQYWISHEKRNIFTAKWIFFSSWTRAH